MTARARHASNARFGVSLASVAALCLALSGCHQMSAPSPGLAPQVRSHMNDEKFRKAVETDRFPSAAQAGI